MSTVLRLLLIASVLFVAYLAVMKPRQLRETGRKARIVAYAYVAAVIIGAILQLAGWRT
ncbi:MAG: hypothetical protein M0R73_08635 [Dehalococcoidia bacterium]|nr:hypothetical protein [Dehalococcoidia bacterium]